ncbi:hypothetical protein Pla175_32820 [Pirellulimonas nuda]|uniref:Copper resistance protein D n=1 Tax=Pirellulimonas nuda TaxID=2528009 RepID=A0A518DEJ6_9BACT|nr:hypothetical protein [Pirellulimonas nuda]QDU89886.1 hypothetical protein Pla175_32820 [Pirellulimonas nuda]
MLDLLLAQTTPLAPAAVPLPVFDAAYFAALVSRVIHTTCGATLLGGIVYLWWVAAPRAAGGDLYSGGRRAWAGCVGACTGLLILSGAYNFWVIYTGNQKLPPLYHALFGAKFLLALAVFALAALLAGKTSLAARMQAKSRFWLNITLAALLAIFVLGAVLKSIPHIPKPAASAATVMAPLDAPHLASYA